MRRLVFLTTLLTSTTALADKSGVAVLDIQGTGIDTQLLPTLTEVLTVEIDALGKYKVVAGRDIQSMLGFEQQKDMLGCTDAACLAEIGGALGVDRIVASHIGKVGSTYVVNIKLINIRKADTEGRVYETVRGEVDALIATIRTSAGKLFANDNPGGAAAASAPKSTPKSTSKAEPKREAEVAQADTPEVETDAGGGRKIGMPSIALWAIGGVAAGAGIVFGVQAKSSEKNANDANYVGGQKEAEKAQGRALMANVAFGISVVSLGVGTVLFLMGGDEAPATALAPVIGPDSAGVAFSGTF
jgi:hypothetical protein